MGWIMKNHLQSKPSISIISFGFFPPSLPGWWSQPLWTIWKSIGMLIPNILEKYNPCSSPHQPALGGKNPSILPWGFSPGLERWTAPWNSSRRTSATLSHWSSVLALALGWVNWWWIGDGNGRYTMCRYWKRWFFILKPAFLVDFQLVIWHSLLLNMAIGIVELHGNNDDLS